MTSTATHDTAHPEGMAYSEAREFPGVVSGLEIAGSLAVSVVGGPACSLIIFAEYAEDLAKVISAGEGATLRLSGPVDRHGGTVLIGNNVTTGPHVAVQHFYGPVGQFAAGDIINGVGSPASAPPGGFRGGVHITLTAPLITSVVASGASRLQMRRLKQVDLSLTLSGSAAVTLDGEALNVRCKASGSSTLHAHALNTEVADVTASGAAGVDLHVSESITATASGASIVDISGAPPKSAVRCSGVATVNLID